VPTVATESEERLQPGELEFEQLVLERDRYFDLFDLAPEPYLMTDPYGIIMEANAAAAALLGTSATSLRGRPFDLFIPLEQRGVFRGKLAALASGTGLERAAWRGGLRWDRLDASVEFSVGRIKHRSLPMVSLCWLLRCL
jgi:PAS domain S-box-containing protein